MNTNKYIHTCLAKKTLKDYRLKPLSPQWSRQAVDTGGKILSSFYYFPRYRPPFGECVCHLYLFPASRYELCVCRNLCACVRVSTNLESPPIMGNFKV